MYVHTPSLLTKELKDPYLWHPLPQELGVAGGELAEAVVHSVPAIAIELQTLPQKK